MEVEDSLPHSQQLNKTITIHIYIYTYTYIFFFLWRCSPTMAMDSFFRFLDHTQRRTTFGRTPLDKWSARRRDLYLTTHNTHNRQTSMPPPGFEPTISAGERPQTYALDSATTGTDNYIIYIYIYRNNYDNNNDTPQSLHLRTIQKSLIGRNIVSFTLHNLQHNPTSCIT